VSRNRSRARRRQSRSHDEADEPWFGKTVYYCTGGAGKARAEVECAKTGLTWLPDGGHSPVRVERGPDLGRTVRCPVCGLVKPLGYKTRKRVREARLTEVDISALPF
jgi:hypothetical protein